jgi:hypothetical protein
VYQVPEGVGVIEPVCVGVTVMDLVEVLVQVAVRVWVAVGDPGVGVKV